MPTAETSTVLDEAFQRMAACGFELPNGFVNHGAMACEALAALGFESEITTWAERFAGSAGPEVRAEKSRSFEWRDALGDYRRLPEWIGFFEVAIAGDGWPSVVEVWPPVCSPAWRRRFSTVLSGPGTPLAPSPPQTRRHVAKSWRGRWVIGLPGGGRGSSPGRRQKSTMSGWRLSTPPRRALTITWRGQTFSTCMASREPWRSTC